MSAGRPRAAGPPSARRAFDIGVALALLIPAAPLIALGALAVRASSPGPVFHRAARVGRGGRAFAMLKLRTMHAGAEAGAAITAPGDRRIFPAGRALRAAKIDELPQLWNVLRGDMSVVGPRPEDPGVVSAHYAPWMRRTLRVRPGLTSPGALYYHLRGEAEVDPRDPERSYAERVLPVKLAIDDAYAARAGVWSDLGVVARTFWAVATRPLARGARPGQDEVAARARLARLGA